jgi:hypothetical protein
MCLCGSLDCGTCSPLTASRFANCECCGERESLDRDGFCSLCAEAAAEDVGAGEWPAEDAAFLEHLDRSYDATRAEMAALDAAEWRAA